MAATVPKEDERIGRQQTAVAPLEIDQAIESAQAWLRSIQKADGHWCGELEGDTILESEYILTLYYLGLGAQERVRKAANYLRRQALPAGGWSIYPGGPAELSPSIKAYFALKLTGEDPETPLMKNARKVIRGMGGLMAANSFTRIYLAIFRQFPWRLCPAVPPEMIMLPDWAPFNIYDMSAWSRCIVVPLAIIRALRPSCEVPASARIDELMVEHPGEQASAQSRSFWHRLFQAVDFSIKFVERRQWLPSREKAIRMCEQWMLDHLEKSDGMGAIFPPIINSIYALRSLGYGADHPLVRSQLRELQKLEIEEDDTVRLQPCFSPVWDTALAVSALSESSTPSNSPALLKAGEWLLSKEVKQRGDWAVKNPHGKPGGWYFEYANEFYPDVDDTFQVLIALNSVRFPDAATELKKKDAIKRGLDWTLSMQNSDGGWASFDRGCDKDFLTRIPFADHNAMIDPSTADITGRGLNALLSLGVPRKSRVIRKAVEFLLAQREVDGSWFGRWGCNFVYGTFLAIQGLSRAGVHGFRESVEWLRSVQNSDGGWGELPESYEDPASKGHGPSTPSQTAWALMGLIAAGECESDAVRDGVDYLLRRQNEDGSWDDQFWTGTGFPEVFYLCYHLYAVYFPLMALGMFRRHSRNGG